MVNDVFSNLFETTDIVDNNFEETDDFYTTLFPEVSDLEIKIEEDNCLRDNVINLSKLITLSKSLILSYRSKQEIFFEHPVYVLDLKNYYYFSKKLFSFFSPIDRILVGWLNYDNLKINLLNVVYQNSYLHQIDSVFDYRT